MNTEPPPTEVPERLIKWLNGKTIAAKTCLSLLYDLDLMPEQLVAGSGPWSDMLTVISHFQSLEQRYSETKHPPDNC